MRNSTNDSSMKTPAILVSLLALALLAACSDDNAPTSAKGTVVGPFASQAGRVEVLWLSADDPGKLYALGSGEAKGAQVSYTHPSPLPAAVTVTVGTVAVSLGRLALFPTDVDLPDGSVDTSAGATFSEKVYGFSARYAVINRVGQPSTSPDQAWLSKFPEGELTCGVCVKGVTSKDYYEPVDCAELQVKTFEPGTWSTAKNGDDLDLCDID